MGACCKAISVNDRRMSNNEIKKKKNVCFPVKKLMQIISSGKRGFGISNTVDMYNIPIENRVTDHNEQKHTI